MDRFLLIEFFSGNTVRKVAIPFGPDRIVLVKATKNIRPAISPWRPEIKGQARAGCQRQRQNPGHDGHQKDH
jgi:hypothetical protein